MKAKNPFFSGTAYYGKDNGKEKAEFEGKGRKCIWCGSTNTYIFRRIKDKDYTFECKNCKVSYNVHFNPNKTPETVFQSQKTKEKSKKRKKVSWY